MQRKEYVWLTNEMKEDLFQAGSHYYRVKQKLSSCKHMHKCTDRVLATWKRWDETRNGNSAIGENYSEKRLFVAWKGGFGS